jgi:hypothetical protein
MRTATAVSKTSPQPRWAIHPWRIAALAVLLASSASAQASVPDLKLSDVELKNLDGYTRMIRTDMRSEKRAAIGDSLGLRPDVKDKFWAVYDRFEKEYAAVWDVRIANTKKYAGATADPKAVMNDAAADALAREFLKNDARMTALRAKYYGEFKAAVGAKVAARFLHVESVFDRIVELQVLAVVPMIP